MIYLAALKRFWPHLVVVFATLALCAWLYSLGAKSERVKANAEIAELKAEHATTLADLERTNQIALQTATDDARATERRLTDEMAARDLIHTQEMTDATKKLEADLAALRAGDVRMRNRFTCPDRPAASSGTAEIGAGTGLGNETGPRGLQREDIALVLRIAGEADAVAIQLRACQAIVRADRQ